MGLRTIWCGRPKVRVIEPNGRQCLFSAPITMPELLHLYPRHCVRHISGSILSTDAELEGGSTYLLLPLPAPFPCSSSSPSSCFLQKEEEDETAIGPGGSLIWKPRSRMRTRRDSNQRHFSKISAQESEANKHNRYNKTIRRERSWQPSLDMISENNALLQTKDEQPVEKMEKKTATPCKHRFNHGSRNPGSATNFQVPVPPGFIF